jgi:hypothetical protein
MPAAVKATVRLTPVAATGEPTAAGARGQGRVIFGRVVRVSPVADAWPIHVERIDLFEHGLDTLELCFAAKGLDGGPPDPRFFWLEPNVVPADGASEEADNRPASSNEAARREKRLRALGYVD